MAEPTPIFPSGEQAPEPLWREVLGSRLRALRAERGETLVQTAERAGVSPQYLSEVERGRKEPSSEMIAALAGALGTTLGELATGVAEELAQLAAFTVVRLGTLGQPRHGVADPGHGTARLGRATPPRATDLQALAA